MLGVGDLLVEQCPNFGLRPEVLLDLLQCALVLAIARLWRCGLVGDIEHGVSGLHGLFYLVEHQAFLALDTRYIQQCKWSTVQLELIALRLSGVVGLAVANDFTVGMHLKLRHQGRQLAFIFQALLHHRLLMLLRLYLLSGKCCTGQVTCCCYLT
ncbi:hypothetical protein D3C73_1060510 [compost metagenome]